MKIQRLVICLSATMAMYPAEARAWSLVWQQDSTLPGYVGGPGCAKQIAVGPNDVPWVIGCSGPGDNGTNKSIFYLQYTPCTVSGGACFGGSYSWVYANGAATYISVDVEAEPYLVTSNGHVWILHSYSHPSTGGWDDLTAQGGYFGGQVPWPGFSDGRLSAVVTIVTPQLFTELFGTPNAGVPSGENEPFSFWGFGYPATTDTAIFSYDASDGATAWIQADRQDNAAAAKIALFTTNSGSGFIQTPWVVNSSGNVYSFPSTSASSGHFVQMPGANVLDITDHYVITYPYVFQWRDSSATSSGAWINIGSIYTSANTLALHIAHAPAVTVQGRSFGPSRLWALDSYGQIFYANVPDPNR